MVSTVKPISLQIPAWPLADHVPFLRQAIHRENLLATQDRNLHWNLPPKVVH